MTWRSLALAATLTVGVCAVAEEGRVEVVADVVLMSNNGKAVDPALASMKETFSKEGFSFSSYKRLSSEKVTLQQNKATEIKVPDNQHATLKLESLKQGTATIAVKVGAVNTTYTLGREGSVFINFGHKDGELVLVLSPITSKKARHLPFSRPEN